MHPFLLIPNFYFGQVTRWNFHTWENIYFSKVSKSFIYITNNPDFREFFQLIDQFSHIVSQ